MKTRINRYRILCTFLLFAFTFLTSNCKKFIDVGAPSDQLDAATAFSDDNTVKSALAGMYTTLGSSNSYDLQLNLSFATGNSSDEMQYYISSTDYDPFFYNNLAATTPIVGDFWTEFYASVYQANAIISGVTANEANLSQPVIKEALGEAKFVRAFCYFYLTNLYGDVPLTLTTSVNTNKSLPRSSQSVVYQQIISDLTDAKNNMATDFSYGNGERIRPNRFAATALLARVYLYTGNWALAQSNASAVISQSSLFSLLPTSGLNGIFIKNNSEAIWQVTGIYLPDFTQEGQYYYTYPGSIPNYQLTSNLINAFEAGDKRFSNWVDTASYNGTMYYYPGKYKQYTSNTDATAEYCTYFRLAEQYLIRAEALAEQNNLTAAAADINVIRNRAGLPNTSARTQANLLLAIEQERRIELFAEYGHRWSDLRRTGRANTVLGAEKSGWKPNDALYPVPKYDRDNDPNLTQNPGY